MEEKCTCKPDEILIFTCSGASNVGQIANQAAVELDQKGVGRMFCLAGIGGHIPGITESAKAGKLIVGVDGCPVACTKKALEHAGFSIGEYVQVTELSCQKAHHFNYTPADVEKVASHVAARIAQRQGT